MDWLTDTIPAWWLYVCALYSILVIIGLIVKGSALIDERDDYKADFEAMRDKYEKERDWRQETDDSAAEIVTTVTPLLEKTDWMTGRWGGQFATLVQMENQRNATVDRVKARLFALPAVQEITATNEQKRELLTASFAKAAPQVGEGVGVAENERLVFDKDGGVRREERQADQ